MRHLLIATQNRGKVAELTALLKDLPYQIQSAEGWPSIEETGKTFAENALIKARHYRSLTGYLSLADDSGLIVDALGGAPGIYSARYAGEGATSNQMIAKLLRELADVPRDERTAYFICAVAVVGKGVERVFEGKCEGLIAMEPRGTEGFGYDPVFYYPELGRTFAELSRAEKAARSHRGRALAKVRNYLTDLVE